MAQEADDTPGTQETETDETTNKLSWAYARRRNDNVHCSAVLPEGKENPTCIDFVQGGVWPAGFDMWAGDVENDVPWHSGRCLVHCKLPGRASSAKKDSFECISCWVDKLDDDDRKLLEANFPTVASVVASGLFVMPAVTQEQGIHDGALFNLFFDGLVRIQESFDSRTQQHHTPH